MDIQVLAILFAKMNSNDDHFVKDYTPFARKEKKIAKENKEAIETFLSIFNLKDIDDPLQVAVHSTVGEQIVNGQGIGVIYARVIRRGDQEDFDTVVPDNLLAVGTTIPANASGLTGKTGYCYVVLGSNNVPTGEVRYYWRESSSSSWSGPRGDSNNPYKYTYSWTFRNSVNEAYNVSDTNIPNALKYAMNNNQQFVYVDASVVNNKITAIVKVELQEVMLWLKFHMEQ